MSNGASNDPNEHGDSLFPNTRWSVVLRARGGTSEARLALNDLCRIYRDPLYFYVRRQGHSHHDAEDTVQSFFLRQLEKDLFGKADHHKGRLRAFLLSSLKDYLVDEYRRARAEKRGGLIPHESLDDMSEARKRYELQAINQESPEKALSREWAKVLLDRVMTGMEESWTQAGKEELFRKLSPYIFVTLDAASRAHLAGVLGLSEANIKVRVTRMTKEYRERLRSEIAETVDSESEIDGEIQDLGDALS